MLWLLWQICRLMTWSMSTTTALARPFRQADLLTKAVPAQLLHKRFAAGLSRSPHRTWGKVVGCTYSYLATIAQVLNGRHKGAEAQPHAPVLKLVIHKQLWDAQLL